MNVSRLFRIEGRVQGVWFRESTRQQAEQLGIHGYAVNLPDGSVEVLACGPDAEVDRLENWLHRGPAGAEVTSVVIGDFTGEVLEGFRTGWKRSDP